VWFPAGRDPPVHERGEGQVKGGKGPEPLSGLFLFGRINPAAMN